MTPTPSHRQSKHDATWRDPALILVIVLLSALLHGGRANAASGTVEREVAALMTALESSDCRFNRNGSWYDGKRAASHLRRKYAYLAKREAIPDTETFIELAASRSSLTGKAYRVRCGDAEPMTSRAWFLARLAIARGPSGRPLR